MTFGLLHTDLYSRITMIQGVSPEDLPFSDQPQVTRRLPPQLQVLRLAHPAHAALRLLGVLPEVLLLLPRLQQ